MTPDDCDRALEHLLRATPSGAGAGDCFDADTLAAWADGALSGEALAAAERHASACARCQSLLAAMVRTSPPAAPRAARWSPAMLVYWGTPLAAAAALVLWVVVGREPTEPAVPSAAVLVDRTATAPADRNLPAAQPAAPPPAAAPEPSLEKRAARPQAARARARAPQQAKEGSAGAAPAATPAPPPPPPTPPPPAPTMPERAPAASTEVRADAQAREALRGAGGGRGGGGVAGGIPASPPPAALLIENARRAETFAGRSFDVVSPDATVRWRVSSGSAVQRSTDGGRSWQGAAIDPGILLIAGSSPSSNVCWLVGPAGAVVLATDGRTFRRLKFPEAVDLTAVRATDGREAVVTTADGRRFATRNGGDTWTLQESPAAPF